MFFSRPTSITAKAIVSVPFSIFVSISICRCLCNYLCTCHHMCLHNNLYIYFYVSGFGSPSNFLFYSHLYSSLMIYLYYKISFPEPTISVIVIVIIVFMIIIMFPQSFFSRVFGTYTEAIIFPFLLYCFYCKFHTPFHKQNYFELFLYCVLGTNVYWHRRGRWHG